MEFSALNLLGRQFGQRAEYTECRVETRHPSCLKPLHGITEEVSFCCAANAS